jgi:hypothetical protein
LDIETAPNTVHTWGLFDQNIGINQILATGYVMCWAAKWGESKRMEFRSVHHDGERNMLERIHALLDEADIVVSYNGIKFDLPTLNKEFFRHDMAPPSPYRQVDLLRVVRQQFRFPSNKLDHVAQEVGLGGKIKHTGHALWIQCMEGDDAAWKLMRAYNKQDVVLLERLYGKLLPWIKHHPNAGLWQEGICCPTCGSEKLQSRGYQRTLTLTYRRLQCQDCGSWSREKKATDNRVSLVLA